MVVYIVYVALHVLVCGSNIFRGKHGSSVNSLHHGIANELMSFCFFLIFYC